MQVRNGKIKKISAFCYPVLKKRIKHILIHSDFIYYVMAAFNVKKILILDEEVTSTSAKYCKPRFFVAIGVRARLKGPTYPVLPN